MVFRGVISVQNFLLASEKKLKQVADNSQAFEALLTDLLKAFNCLPNELLIAKLNSYGFSLKTLKLMNDYLC